MKLIPTALVMLAASMCLTHLSPVHAQTFVASTLEDPDPVTHMAEKVMSEAYRRIGMTLQVREFPAERALFESNEGRVDGELYRKGDLSDTFPRLVKVPVVVSYAEFVVFTQNKTITARDWASLTPYRVGYKRGVKFVEVNLTSDTRATPVPSTEQAFKMLDSGRLDIVVAPRITGLVLLRQLGIDGVATLEPPLSRVPLYHFLHEHRGLLPRLTATLQQMENEGVIKQLHRQVEQGALAKAK